MTFLLSLVLALGPGVARAHDPDPSFREALRYLDGDAGLVLALRPTQLQALQELWVRSMPEQKGTSDLAALGAIAILGFHPLQTRAWEAVGIDVDARILAQVAALDRQAASAADRGGNLALWRTRIILPARDVSLATRALSNIRLRDRARLSEPSGPALQSLLGVRASASERVRRKLLKAGVFMLGRPAPMDGLVVASAHGKLVVLDWLAPYGPGKEALRWGKHEAMLMSAIGRRPDALQLSSPGAAALLQNQIGLWVRPTQLGTALSAAEVDGLPRKSVIRRHRRCEPFRGLALQSSFTGLSAGIDILPGAVDLELRWFLPDQSDLIPILRTDSMALTPEEKPLLRATIALNELGALRGRKRAPAAADWDLLWNKAKACGRGSKVFALAVAWPEIAGLFLDELSALDPSAGQLISAVGGANFTVSGQGDAVQINAEAWVRKPGNAIAKKWLALLFGSEKLQGAATRWGHGRMQPYAIDGSQGSIIGTGLRPGSRAQALSSARVSSQAGALMSVDARPADLVPVFPKQGWLKALQIFPRAEATFVLEPGALHFKSHLEED